MSDVDDGVNITKCKYHTHIQLAISQTQCVKLIKQHLARMEKSKVASLNHTVVLFLLLCANPHDKKPQQQIRQHAETVETRKLSSLQCAGNITARVCQSSHWWASEAADKLFQQSYPDQEVESSALQVKVHNVALQVV